MSVVRPIAVGDLLDGKYQVERALGEGSMGVVFTARHLTLNKRVAIKTLRAEIARDEELVGRFEQEARAASAIGHPNIIEVFDLGTAPGGARYMVMEHLEGESLAELLAQQPLLAPDRAVAIGSEILSALAAAHRRGIVHRDLKPENVFVVRSDETQERVKLLDFGISKVLEAADPEIAGADSAARATRMGAILGTPLYMAPEQARGQVDIDHRVDLWAVGCVLYEMLCGRTPFGGDNYHQILVAILDGEFPPPRQLRPAVSPALEAVILRAMAGDRDQRFPSAAEMRDALVGQPARANTPVPAVPTAPTLATGGAAASATPVTPLAESQTGLAAAASRADGNDAALLDALERLNVAVGTGDGAVVSVDANPEPPSPRAPRAAANATPSSAPSRASEPAAAVPPGAHDPFAPPESSTAELSLSLDLADDSGGNRSARTAAVPRTPSSTLRTQSARQPVAHRSGGGVVGPAIKLVLVVVLLAGAGFAGYRYYHLGYLLSPPAPKRVPVALELTPVDAELTLDGARVVVADLTVTVDVEHRLEAHAKGRMPVRRTLVVRRGERPALVLYLPYFLTPIDVAVPPGNSSGGGDPADGEVDAGLTKLAVYSRILAAVGPPLLASEHDYLESTQGKKPSAKHPPVVRGLPADVVSESRLGLGSARESTPPMATVDQLAADYLQAIDDLGELTTRLEQYYQAREYEVDKLKLGLRSHRQLLERLTRAQKLHAELTDAVSATRAAYRERELAAIGEREGKRAHFLLRRLALDTRAWVWAEVRNQPAAVRQTTRDAVISAFEVAARQPADDLAAMVGARQYLDVARALVELARDEGAPVGDQLVDLYNRSVDAFNTMVL